jgi:hypothetical protein
VAGRAAVDDNPPVSEPDRVLLPEGTRLLHIGPHKTATTAIQSAFHAGRRALRAQGVHYAGPDRHAVIAAQAAIEMPRRGGRRVFPIDAWRRLAAEIERSTANRVVLSSEWFADARPEAVRRIVEELGPQSLQVVLTVRPLARVLPSQWQQYVKAGLTASYPDWLASVFEGDGSAMTPTFWHRHRHDRLAARWADVVGRDRVTVIVLDETDRSSILRTFEALLGLRVGTLVAEEGRGNRSLTLPEAELMRAINAALRREVPDPNLRLNLGLYGAAASLEARRPVAREPAIQTPAWAMARAAEVQREIVEGLAASGLRSFGDVSALLIPGPPAATTSASAAEPIDPWSTWPRLISVAAFGVLRAAGLARTGPATGPRRAAQLVRPLSTERLHRVFSQRLRHRVKTILTVGGTRGRAVAEPAPSVRALTKAETELLGGFAQELESAGLAADLSSRLRRDGLTRELLRRPDVSPDEVPSAALGASLALGIVRASGLIRGGGRLLPPPRARFETSEVALVPTGTLLLVIAGRLLRSALRRDEKPPVKAEPAAILPR